MGPERSSHEDIEGMRAEMSASHIGNRIKRIGDDDLEHLRILSDRSVLLVK
jgi:hypothetical protein